MTAPVPPSPADPSAAASGPPSFERAKPRRRWLRLLAIPVALVFVVWVGVVLFFKPYSVPSPSMRPTIVEGDRILVREGDHTPKPEELVVLRPPATADDFEKACESGEPEEGLACATPSKAGRATQSFVQRIVGSPGDRVEMQDGRVLRNGRPTDDAGFDPCDDPYCSFAPITVPAGHWFTLGDNRGNSVDGRSFGPIPTDAIVGPVRFRYWPIDRLGGL